MNAFFLSLSDRLLSRLLSFSRSSLEMHMSTPGSCSSLPFLSFFNDENLDSPPFFNEVVLDDDHDDEAYSVVKREPSSDDWPLCPCGGWSAAE